MSWRVVVVRGRCKLEYKLGYLVCRGEEVKKVFLNEISSLVVESTAVSMTAALLSELVRNKVNVLFCDEKHNPVSQLMPLYGRHDCSGILRRQLSWKEENKRAVWTEIVRMKIRKQLQFLSELQCPQAELLRGYIDCIENNDVTNREGHAAKVYFDALFGLSFKRGDKTFLNGALNYGYTILLSAFNREIAGCGFNTQLGIAHKSEFNQFNLSCDLVEPFRVIVDRAVFGKDNCELSPDFKRYLCDVLNREIKIDGKYYVVSDAIGIFVKSVFNALEEGDLTKLKEYEF